MRTRRGAIPRLWLLLALLSAVSCAKELSRGKAKDLIVANLDNQSEARAIRKIYIKSYHGGGGGGFLPVACLVSGERYADSKNSLDSLEAKGLINVTERALMDECNIVQAVVTLTSAGRQFLVLEAPDYYAVRTCTIVFGEITGIQFHQQFGVAEADYTLRRTNCSPFADPGAAVTINRSDSFTKFDDGWRLNQ